MVTKLQNTQSDDPTNVSRHLPPGLILSTKVYRKRLVGRYKSMREVRIV